MENGLWEHQMNSWPGNVDGDVFRRMQRDGFDFTREHTIDFNVDFEDWPPPNGALDKLRTEYPALRVIQPDSHGRGYVLIEIRRCLDYDFVMEMQRRLTESMKPFGGWCDSWGAMQE